MDCLVRCHEHVRGQGMVDEVWYMVKLWCRHLSRSALVPKGWLLQTTFPRLPCRWPLAGLGQWEAQVEDKIQEAVVPLPSRLQAASLQGLCPLLIPSQGASRTGQP